MPFVSLDTAILYQHPHPTARAMASTAMMIEQMFSPLTFPPRYSWIRASYSMDKLNCQPARPVAEHIPHHVRDAACEFFEYIHAWMPFISKKRFYDLYLPSQFQYRSDVAIQNPTSHKCAKSSGSSIISLPVLQAAVLLALYEFGHAIYPAAYLSVEACARYAHALGINCSGLLQIRRVLTLVEGEERRRLGEQL